MRGKSNVIKRNVEKVWGARYTLGARHLPKNTVLPIIICIFLLSIMYNKGSFGYLKMALLQRRNM
jgi:hypothetical protein